MGIPRKYSSFGAALVGTNKTLVTLVSNTGVRPGLWQVVIGSGATAPADYNGVFYGNRFTAAGTAAASPTPSKFDTADIAAVATVGSGGGTNFSVEPTYTATDAPIVLAGNLRDQLIFFAGPGYEVMAPATAANGIGIYSLSHGGSAVSASCHATIYWIE